MPNKANWPRAGWPWEARSTKFEIRMSEMQNKPNLVTANVQNKPNFGVFGLKTGVRPGKQSQLARDCLVPGNSQHEMRNPKQARNPNV